MTTENEKLRVTTAFLTRGSGRIVFPQTGIKKTANEQVGRREAILNWSYSSGF